MAKYNDKANLIKKLNEKGKNILEVEINDKSRFFLVNQFEPPIGGSVSAAPYITFRGHDITEFLVNNVFTEGNRNLFEVGFQKLEAVENRDFKFSDNHVWRYFE